MRRSASIILMIAFIIVSVSGVQMAVTPKPQSIQQQSVGNPDGNKSMAVSAKPFYPKKAHEWAGYLFIGAGLVHIVLNRRPMLAYLRPRKKY